MIKKVIAFIFLAELLNAITLEEIKVIHKEEGVFKALPLYKKLAKEEDPKAMYELAKIYLRGEGIAKSTTKAYNLLKESSSLGFNEATYTLAKLYFSQKSPYYNKAKAYNTFIDASEQNHAKAFTMIGKHLLFGITVKKDYKKAVYYFKEASKRKDYSANCYVAYMYASGKGVFPNFGRANVFAKDQYEKGNQFCIKVWNDYNLGNYPSDNGWNIGDYNKPIK